MIDPALLGMTLLVAFGFSRPKISAPPPPPPPPQKSDAEIQAEKAKARMAITRRRGRQASILAGEQRFLTPTGGAGVEGEKQVTLGA